MGKELERERPNSVPRTGQELGRQKPGQGARGTARSAEVERVGRSGCGRQDPQTIVPEGLEWPGGRESGRAGARSPIRAAGTVLRPGAAGGRGRWPGGRRAAALPGRRASCRACGARGTVLGGAPSAGQAAPGWAQRFLRSAGLRTRDAGSPLGRGRMSLPDPGVPLGRGSVCGKRGILWGGAPSPRRAARLDEPRGCESAPGSRDARRSRSCVAVQGCAVFPEQYRDGGRARTRGYAGDPGRARVPGVRGAPGGARWDKCGGGRGGGGGRVWGARWPPSGAQRGGRCPGSAMLLRGREGRRSETGPYTWRAREDQRRRQSTPDW